MTVHGILLAFIWSEKGILQNLQGRFSSDSDKVDKGMVYLQDAAQLNECAAEYELAYRTIKNFDRVKLNEIKTFHYLEHSAGQEYPPALYLLGTLYQKGENGVLKDEEKAFSLLEKAAFWGVPLAQKAFVKEDADWKKEILQPGNEADIVEKAKIFCSCNTYNKDSNGILNVYRGISYADEAQANCCMQEEFAVSKMIQKCNTLETLIDTKQELIERKNSFTVYRVEDAIKKLNEKITSFSNGKQTSDAEILKYVKDKEKAKSIILGFKSPKHFSAYKKTLAEQGISNDVIVEMKTFIEERMRKVFSKELEDYQYYLKLKKNTSSSLTAYLGVIVWFVIGYFATGAWGTPGMIAWVVAVFIFFDTFITRRKVGRRKRGWKIINDFLNQGFALIKK